MKQQSANPMEDLLWDALIIRLKDQQDDDSVLVFRVEGEVRPVRRTVRLKVDFAMNEAIRQAGMGMPVLPRNFSREDTQKGISPDPAGGAGVLIRYLGNDAVPIAAELLCKGLADDWEPWKLEMLRLTLQAYKWWSHNPNREQAMRIKDVRAGWALLWIAENFPDEHLGEAAAEDLRSFPDPKLLRAAREARDRATDEGRRMILGRAAKNVEAGLHAFERAQALRQRQVQSQPASRPPSAGRAPQVREAGPSPSTGPAPGTRSAESGPTRATSRPTTTRVFRDDAIGWEPLDLHEAARQFREQRGPRMNAARNLLPFLKPGMHMQEVEELLGPPSRQKAWDGGVGWTYILYFSQTLSVQFDDDGRVTRVTSSVATRPAGAGTRPADGSASQFAQ
jgi:hypothetical protein